MIAPRHEMILASAGSGKTFALTDRFVQLLALGARPDQIVALTFTRKAAGEFFDGILNKLAQAASDSAFAADLADRIGAPTRESTDYLALLRGVVDAMPQLSLSTFDAFFARIVRSFPLELGLAGDFEVLQEHAAMIERRRVLQLMFERTAGEPGDAQRDFIEAFKRATFGLEEKRLTSLLDEYLNDHHDVYLSAPDASLWGNPKRIWPEGCPWLPSQDAMSTQALRDWIGSADLQDKQHDRWLAFLAAVEIWSPGSSPPREMTYVLEKAFAAWEALSRGDAVLEFDRKKQELSPDACRALCSIVLHVTSGELRRRLETTRGIHAILTGYERVYHDAVRRVGRLTFADVQRLLQQGEPLFETLRSADEAAVQARELIDWRLDGQFEHWLLDEFQDTSLGQWSVLQNLVDEVVQDDSGRRTLFYVGDVKQAIYAWREGDSRLFREIQAHYNAGGSEVIMERRLDRSWRSGPPILSLVNGVFGDAEVLSNLFPGPAAERWNDEWRPHESAVPNRPGHATWLIADDESKRWETTLDILREIEPVRRGLTAAVLTQTNKAAAQLADYLRREGHLSAIAESDLHVCNDNPLTTGLLALFQAAAHPGDTLARAHVSMTPLREFLQSSGSRGFDGTIQTILETIHADGFERAVEEGLRVVEPRLGVDDDFSRERGRQMAEAARLFDETGSRDVAEFIQFMQRHTVRPTEISSVIRVMTIYKAKGLGFDLVVLPDLEGEKLATRRSGLGVQKDSQRAVSWVLDLPTKLFCDPDPVLSQHVVEAEADACYDKLALFYVATTRARHGLYLISKDPGASSSRNFPRLLAETLGTEATKDVRIGSSGFSGFWSNGDSDWFHSIETAEPQPPHARIAVGRRSKHSRPRRLVAHTASGETSGMVTGATLFAAEADSAGFGTQVHDLLAQVEWWDASAIAAWVAIVAASDATPPAVEAARACLEAPENAAVFRVDGDAAQSEVWRERSFEFADGDAWITGKFDRVVIERNGDGGSKSVCVYDFKTDRTGQGLEAWEQTAAKHVRQMRFYRRAAATLAGVPPERVTAAIILVNAVDAEGRRAPPIPLE